MNKPDFPMLFMKPNTSVIGHGDSIVLPMESVQTEYECELTVVIGKDAAGACLRTRRSTMCSATPAATT